MESTNSSHANFIHPKDNVELGPVLPNSEEVNNNTPIYNNEQAIPISTNADYYGNCDNISQIQNKGITQPKSNIFHISHGVKSYKTVKCLTYFFFTTGILCPIMIIVSYILNSVGLLDFWLYMFSSVTVINGGYFFGYNLFFFTCFILDNNEITIERKALCRSEKTVYKQGELTEVKFSYSYFNNKKYVYK